MSQFIEMFGNCKSQGTLSSLCATFIDGDWIESKDQSDNGIRLIQTGNVGFGFFKGREDKSRYITEETFKKLNCTEVVPGDILISRLPDPIGRACIVPEGIGKAITAVDCTIVRLNATLLPEFLISFSKTALYASQINKIKTGTTRLRVSRGNLGNVIIPIPPIESQHHFAAIAQQADKSKFGDFRSQFIEMFQDSPLVRLGDHIETQSGGTPNTKKGEYYDGGTIPWLSSGEVNLGYISSTEKYITEEGLENSAAKWVPKNSVVIAMYGATAGKVGFITIPLTTNQAVCALLPNDAFNPLYLYYAVSSKKDWMIAQCRGAAQPNISQGIIRSMKIPMPSLSEQIQFVNVIKQADKSKSVIQKALVYLNDIQSDELGKIA